MPSPSASDLRTLVGALAFAAGTAVSATAAADVKHECSASYDRVQALRADGKLVSARAEGVVCARDACPGFIKADCVKWLGEIDAITPTVSFEVRDAEGKETTAVQVVLDGKPWLPALNGKSSAIDPGSHTLRYVLASGETLDATVQIREGEKNRKLTASFRKDGVQPPSDEKRAADEHAPSRSIGPWVVGGVGVAGLVVGGILAGLVASDKSKTDNPSNCNQTTLKCNPTGLSAASQGKALGAVSTVGFVVGGLGVGAAVVWLVVRRGPSDSKEAPAAAFGMGPVVTAGSAAWRLQGSW